jgi:hypothetical protein
VADLLPGRGQRRSWIALGVSVVVHTLLFFVVIKPRLPQVPEHPPLIVLAQPDQVRVYPMPFSAPRPFIGRGIARSVLPPANPAPPPPEPVVTAAVIEQTGPDTIVPRAPGGLHGPEMGDGRLWVRPLPLPPKELAQRLTRTNAELVDSAVTAIIQQFLDSITTPPGTEDTKLPDWTTEVDGVKFGVDSRNVYIAGLKIPAAILALLPIPAGGNQQDAFKRSDQVYDDLHRAAQRATTLDEFKQAIRDLRRQRQEQKDFERAQLESPDSLAVPDSLPVEAPH